MKDGSGVIPDAINMQALLAFGLLHSENTSDASAKVFYKMLNRDNQPGIACDDKDFSYTFVHLAQLCTRQIFQFSVKYGGLKPLYTEEELC